MSLFSTPEAHAANSPSTWTVTKAADRVWNVSTADGVVLDSTTTKKAAEALKTSGHLVRMYEQEGAWYAGKTPAGWKTWEQVKFERARNAAWQAERRAAARAAEQTPAEQAAVQDTDEQMERVAALLAQAEADGVQVRIEDGAVVSIDHGDHVEYPTVLVEA
jgi:hypothetical protein